MKKNLFKNLALGISVMVLLFASSCEKNEEAAPPELPPYETMAANFDEFKVKEQTTKSLAMGGDSMATWNHAHGVVGIWSFMLTATMVVPVTAYYHSFSHSPVNVGDKLWQWEYEVDGFTSKYIARLTGEVRDNDVTWEMYLTKEGVQGFPEFKWFEGTSSLDGKSGAWTLYHSYQFQEAVLKMDWKRTNDEVGEVKYTYVRELDDNREINLFNGSWLTYGKQDDALDAFFKVHWWDAWTQKDKDAEIMWSTSEYYGKVKNSHFFGDEEWHCWDSYGYDMVCE